MADAVVEMLKRKLNALESAYGELKRRFDRADQNGLDTLTAQSLFVSPMLHGPYRNSVDGTHSMTFIVDYDDNIAYLYSAKLKLRLSAVRSNVSATASAASGSHGHKMFNSVSASVLTDTTTKISGTTVADHTHGVNGAFNQYAAASGNNAYFFTTDYSDLTTYETAATHTHTMTMTYGIYEGSAPSTPGITLAINGTDRTTALGGAWDADATLDITDYLRDGAKVPRRQDNTIVLTSTELIDLEVICRSLVTTRLAAS